ncbi:tetratricopeptide repeat protein 36-like [Saccostrea cucullata]|uniref:tetratricopeptide repeat protein 36-like n=1 Tax=Saccostrea cuccullata TaxID=36930 RepID=UPI002ED33FE8
MSSGDHNHVSAHDSAVLNRIFNPNLPYGDVVDEEEVENETEEETDEIKVSKQLEIEGVQAAESGDIETALNSFSRAIQNTPQRASGYNNRAQALRLKGDVQASDLVCNCLLLKGAINHCDHLGNSSLATQRLTVIKLQGL